MRGIAVSFFFAKIEGPGLDRERQTL